MQHSRCVTKKITALSWTRWLQPTTTTLPEGEPDKMDRLDEILKQLVVNESAGQQQAGISRARTVREGSDGGRARSKDSS